ncbi:MAG: Fic family protein [Thiohalomonadales bacterium]
MAKTGNQLLAEALKAANRTAINNIVHSKNIKPKQQALLVKNGYFKRIIKGWYLFDADVTSQSAGESALWYESIWFFIGQYLTSRFKNNYWLSPGASLDLHTENNTMPAQVVVFVNGITSDIVKLPNNMSLVLSNSNSNPVKVLKLHDVNVYPLEMALAISSPAAYKSNPMSMQVALRNANFDSLVGELVRIKNVASIGRIIGAYDALEMRPESKKIEAIISGVGFESVKIVNPFDNPPVLIKNTSKLAPSATRVRMMWQQMRHSIIDVFAEHPPEFDFFSMPLDKTLALINELYVSDAYNSLSIEGYKVTSDLIERVSTGDWSPETIEKDNKIKDALAARGYYGAFNHVIDSVTAAHNKEDLNYLIDVGLTQWVTSLFKPRVVAGIVSELDIVGFRKGPIYIRGSNHVPPASEQLMDCMTTLKECIAEENSYPVKAILGHFFLGYIHPFMDGNGRTARFLMNFLFIIGGYNWVVIKQESRESYMDVFETASVNKNITPFVEFILATKNNADKDSTS